jgi:hypothetical protein
MEEFFQENRDSYIKQVATFKPSQNQAKDAGGELGEEDTLIAARVRPLLQKRSRMVKLPAFQFDLKQDTQISMSCGAKSMGSQH